MELHYEIINIRYKDDVLWGDLLNKKHERLQQLVLIAPLSEIFKYLENL